MIVLKHFSLKSKKIKKDVHTRFLIRDLTLSFRKSSAIVLFGEEASGVREFFNWLQGPKNDNYEVIIQNENWIGMNVGELFNFIGEKEKTIKEKTSFFKSSICINLDDDFTKIEIKPKYIFKQRFSKHERNIRIKDFFKKLDILNLDRSLFDTFFFQMKKEEAKCIYLLLSSSLNYSLIMYENVNTNIDILFIHKLISFNTNKTFLIHSNNLASINLAEIAYIFYAGEVLELGAPEELLYYPQHPYLWDIITSMPKFYQNDFKPKQGYYSKYAIEVQGDPYASRNEYATNLDYIEKPKWYKLSKTHFARTFLLHNDIKGTFKLPIEIAKRWEIYHKRKKNATLT